MLLEEINKPQVVKDKMIECETGKNGTKISTDERLSCAKHDMAEVIYFCQTCESPLCTDGIIEETEHRQHDLAKLDRLYQDAKQKIEQILTRF